MVYIMMIYLIIDIFIYFIKKFEINNFLNIIMNSRGASAKSKNRTQLDN